MIRNFFDRPRQTEPQEQEDDASPAPAPSERRWKPAALYRWFERAGISQDTVDLFGCYLVQHPFPASDTAPAAEYPAITIPHMAGGREVNRRLRPPSGKPEILDDPSVPIAFGVDSIEVPDMVWVCEAELDVMALVEAGYRQVIALLDAPGDTDRRFPALQTHADLFTSVKRWVLCASRTDAGLAWREDLAARLGRHRCLTVDWPQDALRPSDTLAGPGGAEAVQRALEAAAPYPIDGLQRFDGSTLAELRRRAPPAVMTTGTTSTDMIGLRFPVEGRLIVISGVPNAGKSPWMRYVMMHLINGFSRRFAVFTPEMNPWEEFVASCVEVQLRKRFWRRRGVHPDTIMSDEEMVRAADWLGQRMTMIAKDSQEDAPDLDWILDRSAMAVLRDGSTDILVDPWNEIAHDLSDATEANYNNRSLQRCKAFCARHGTNFWIIVHPKTQTAFKPGAKLAAPGAYEINGGAAWANKTDLGITVHRPEEDTEIHVWKAKHLRWGRKGTVAKIYYDINTGRYFDDPSNPELPNMDPGG